MLKGDFMNYFIQEITSCVPYFFYCDGLAEYLPKSLQLTLAACCLAHTVLNIWSHLRLSDACYPVADLPCRDGIYTRWNYRPCSAAHPFDCYTIFFACVSSTLKDFGLNPKNLGADMGMTAVLHTHSRKLDYHPHIHVVVPGGGIDK